MFLNQFAILLGVVAILLKNVMEVFSVIGSACWIGHAWFSKESVCCVCDPSVCLDAPSIYGYILI